MAKYRPIQIRIWKDPDFEKYSANMKLIFIYLCTNELTTESGIYAISTKTISQETGIPQKTVDKLLPNGLKNIAYDFKNNCVFIKNFLKYSVGGSPELIRKSIENNYEEFNTPLWNEFIEKYPEKSKGLQRVDKPLEKGSIEIDIEIDNRNRNKGDCKGDKKKYGENQNVLLTEEEHKKLIDKFGEEGTKDWIEELDLGIGSKGYKYESHYLTILSWNRKREKEKPNKKDEDWRL